MERPRDIVNEWGSLAVGTCAGTVLTAVPREKSEPLEATMAMKNTGNLTMRSRSFVRAV